MIIHPTPPASHVEKEIIIIKIFLLKLMYIVEKQYFF